MANQLSYHALLKQLMPDDWRQSEVFRAGIEREMLRADAAGELAQTPHPTSWGSAHCNTDITLDFSEAQPELVTPPFGDLSALLEHLRALHGFVARRVPESDRLWFLSMPPRADEGAIPLAHFGMSNSGRLKTLYRQGLANRYGRKMQIICGVHFNYSWSADFWKRLHQRVGDSRRLSVFVSENYLALSRNYLRLSWLLAYLFGATPAIDRSFLRREAPELQDWKQQTLIAPYATSLRMSRLGYVNSSRCSSSVSFNSLTEYLSTLYQAITTECPGYSIIGHRDENGDYRQLNTHLLQSEAEHYALIRPKQPPHQDERPFVALRERGVDYVEVRALDIQPDTPLGAHPEQLEFIRLLLLYCLLQPNPPIDREQDLENSHNHQQAALLGRQPGVMLRRESQDISLLDWGLEVLGQLRLLAEKLDYHLINDGHYQAILERQERLLRHPEATPSARVLEQIQSENLEYLDWGQAVSERHLQALRAQPPTAVEADLERHVQASLKAQQELEAASQVPFEVYLREYGKLKPAALTEEGSGVRGEGRG